MERQKIIEFLANPKSYPQQIKNVKHLQTYISDVFLTGKFAYKIKKPVNYGYLDFTTLARRKFYCYQELKLNRRLSREMYLKVLPIVEKDGRFKLGDSGKIVDYVLKMKEIPEKYIMHRLVKKHKINEKTIDKIAKIIADFHQRAETSKLISYFGSFRNIKKNWQENFIQTKPFIGKTINKKDFYFLKSSVEKFINNHQELFQQRIKNKKIRDCHGDLHTGNIFVTPQKIYIFDCIEFTERFRYQDIISEVAFLAMDLDYLKRGDLSNYFVKRYADLSGDTDLEKLLPFYKCYRAYVKGKVFGFFTKEKTFSSLKKRSYQKIAKESFIWAKKYAEKMGKPILIIGFGLPGTGKSRRLDLLAKEEGLTILKTDKIRKEIQKKVDYRKESRLAVYREMFRRAEKILKSGKNLILDASFIEKEPRGQAKKIAEKLGTKYYFIEFYTDEKTIKKRFLERAKEKKPLSDADWQVYQYAKQLFQPIKNEKNYFKINTAQSPEQCVKEIIEKLAF